MKSLFPICVFIISLLLTVYLPAQTVSTFIGPNISIDDDLIWDAEGNLYGSNYDGSSVFKVTPSGERSVYMGGFNTPNGLAFDNQGILYVADNIGDRIYKVTPDSVKTQFGDPIDSPSGLHFDRFSDTLLVTQYGPNRVVKLSPDGVITPFLSGSPLNGPVGLAYDDDDKLYISNFNDGKILRLDPGNQLTEIADVPGTSFGSIGFIEYAGGYIYATGIGVHRIYRISLAGEMSVFAGTGTSGLLNGPIADARFANPNGIVASPDGSKLYISDYGTKSIREISGIMTSIDWETDPRIPAEFNLEQNYPNPFNPETTIRFQMTTAEAGSLKVFDMNGRLVQTLLSGTISAGTHTLRWDGKNANGAQLASGIYFYKLSAGKFSQVRKMILMR